MLTSSPSQELSNINNNTGINKVLYTTHDIINNHHSIQDNIENSASTVSDTVDDIVIVAYPEYKEDVRQLLIQHSDNCDECIQSPLEETHYFNDTTNLYFKATEAQIRAISKLDKVKSAVSKKEIQQNIKLAYDRHLFPGIGKNLTGTSLLTKIIDRNTSFDPITSKNGGTFVVNASAAMIPSDISNYCLALSTYINLSSSNYGLYSHDSPFIANTINFPNTAGINLSSYNIGENVDVIVIDSGIDPNHPEFLNANGSTRVVLQNWTTFKDDLGNTIQPTQSASYYSDPYGHGTFCASIIGGNTCGWAPGCSIYSLKSVDAGADSFSVINALKLVRAFILDKKEKNINRPTIINNSWGYSAYSLFKNMLQDINLTNRETGNTDRTYGGNNIVVEAINSLIDDIISVGGIIVTAAGNNNDYIIPVSEQIDHTYFLIPYGYSYIDFPRSGYIDNTKAIENIRSNNLSSVYESSYRLGMCPDTLSAFNTQYESPVINVGCVYPEDSLGYISKNRRFTDKSGLVNRGIGELFIKSFYSNYGNGVDIFACGYNTIGATASSSIMNDQTRLTDYIGYNSGTSFACPQVVGSLVLYLNDHLSATGNECKQWLINNALSGRIAEFDNTNVEIAQSAKYYGSDFQNLTTYKLPTLKNYNDYFDEVYTAEGYNNISILNNLDISDKSYMTDFSFGSPYCENDNYIFIPQSHKYCFIVSVASSTVQERILTNIQYRLSSIMDYDLCYSSIDYYAVVNLRYEPTLRYNVDIDDCNFFYSNPNFVPVRINAYKKTSTGVVFLTSITHPYNTTGDLNLMPKLFVDGGVRTNQAFASYPFKPHGFGHPAGAVVDRRIHHKTPDLNDGEWSDAKNFNQIAYKNNTLIVGDTSTECVFIYKNNNDIFSLSQVISGVHIASGFVDTWSLTPDSRLHLFYQYKGGRIGHKIDISDDASYIAIPYSNVTKNSHLLSNRILSGVSPYSTQFNVWDAYFPGVVNIYKYNISTTRYEFLSSIIND